MAEAFQCDRCGGFQHGRPAQGVDLRQTTVVPAGVASVRKNDLCDECLADCLDFLNGVAIVQVPRG